MTQTGGEILRRRLTLIPTSLCELRRTSNADFLIELGNGRVNGAAVLRIPH